MQISFPGRGTGANQYASSLLIRRAFSLAWAREPASRTSVSKVSRDFWNHGPSISNQERGFGGRSALSNRRSQSRRYPSFKIIPIRGDFQFVSSVVKV